MQYQEDLTQGTGEEAAIWRQIGREYVVNSKPLRKIA